MYKKIKVKNVLLLFLLLVIVGGIFSLTVFAENQKEQVFDTEEDKDSLLIADDGQEQVRLVKLKEMQEARRIEEKRLAEEKRKEEERIAKKKKEEEDRLAREAKNKNQSISTATSSVKANNKSGRSLGTFQATAYGPDCYGCSGVTANGTDIRNGNIYSGGYRVIAADPRVIPMNSIVKITYSSGSSEMAIVADTGGAIKGNIIDIAFPSEAQAKPFGRQQVQIELVK